MVSTIVMRSEKGRNIYTKPTPANATTGYQNHQKDSISLVIKCITFKTWINKMHSITLLNDGAKRNRLLYLKIMYTAKEKSYICHKSAACAECNIYLLFITSCL